MEKNYAVMNDLRGYLDYEQIEELLTYILNDNSKAKYKRNHLFVLLLSRTGRRVSELLSLNLNDIDFENKEIRWNILKKKSKMMKVKALDTYSVDILKEYCGENYELIETHNGKIFNFKRDWARKLVWKYCTKFGIKFIGDKLPHPHHFRHSFAINYLRNVNRNEAIRLLQQDLEHSKIDVTAQYLQFSNEDQRAIKENLFKKNDKN